jgi:hypothetical protein
MAMEVNAPVFCLALFCLALHCILPVPPISISTVSSISIAETVPNAKSSTTVSVVSVVTVVSVAVTSAVTPSSVATKRIQIVVVVIKISMHFNQIEYIPVLDNCKCKLFHSATLTR